MAKKFIKQGIFMAEKWKYPDGVGCTIWNTPGCCYDFPEECIDDLIRLLERLKGLSPQTYKEVRNE